MSSTPSFWLPSLALVAIAMAAPAHEAAAQGRARPPTTPPAERAQPATPAVERAPVTPPAERAPATPAPGRTTTPGADSGPGGLSTAVTTAPVAAIYTLPTITYGEPMPPPAVQTRSFDARIPRFENVSVAARVNGRSVSRELVVLNGRQGIENAPIDDRARRLLGMHVRTLNLDESTVYFFDPEVASQWLATHSVGPDVGPEEEGDDDNGGSGCGFQNLGNCASDPVGALEDAGEAVAAEFERARERAEDHWNDTVDGLADAWDEALNCFADHRLPGGSVPLRFDITPTMTVSLAQSSARGSGSGSVSGSVGLGIPMEGDLQAKVDFFYIPCLPFVVRPRSLTITGDLTVGEQLAINATASGAFNKTYTIPPTGGPRIPIQVIPIIVGGVPVAVLDLSAYIEGEVEVAATGSVTSNFTLSNEHRSTFDFTCSGEGCRSGSGGRPTASSPVTTTQSVQIEGQVSAKPGIYTALMLTLNANVMSARLGPQPYLLGTAAGCGAASASQTDGVQSSGEQNAALVADLDWGVDFRAEALIGGQVVGNSFRDVIVDERHVWFQDLVPGGSSALRAAIAGPTQAATGQPAVYKLRMPSCYPYDETARYRVAWTGDAAPTAVPASACEWQSGEGSCRFNPRSELELRFAWPAAGNYLLAAALIGRDPPHETFDPRPPATELAVAVTGEASTTTGGGAGGGAAGPTADRGQRGGSSTGPGVDRPGAAGGSACCDIVPNPAMRGRLGRVAVAYPEEVSARIDVYRAGETESLAGGYGDAAFDLFPGTYDVTISGKRIAGVTVRSGNDTQIKVGVLRVTASDRTRVDLVDQADGRSLIGGYGTDAYGLPIGEVGVQVAGQTEAVVIEAGQVTDF